LALTGEQQTKNKRQKNTEYVLIDQRGITPLDGLIIFRALDLLYERELAEKQQSHKLTARYEN
jgi:hypothetical protein